MTQRRYGRGVSIGEHGSRDRQLTLLLLQISFTPAFNASSLSRKAAEESEVKEGGGDGRYYSLSTALVVRGKLLGKTGVEVSRMGLR